MGRKIAIICHASNLSITTQIALMLSEDDEASEEPKERAIEIMLETSDCVAVTPRDLFEMGIKTRGTKRDDVPRPKDLYRQRKGRKP